jgi:hypothetical protein
MDFSSRFNQGIQNSKAVLKKGWEKATRKIAILVDRSRKHRTAMLLIPCRVVGPTAKKGHPKRSSEDNHAGRS